MRLWIKAAALAVLIGSVALPPASAAETAPAGDPGEEIKDGIVKFGHGIRDGAVRAWGAVKSAVHSGAKALDTPPKQAPQKDPAAAK